jgi:predicted XRE-type DNA-binding protein
MKRIELVRLQSKFSLLVSAYLQDNKLTQAELAERVGIQRGHLNELITSQSRKLSAYYLMKFIQEGIIKVSEINDGKPLNEREEMFWDQANEAENYDTLKQIAELRKLGGNVKEIINAAIVALRTKTS